MERKKRTTVDWDKHEYIKKEDEFTKIYQLKKPDTICQSVTLINSCGILTATGDYGNWVFCREFHPGPENRACNYYFTQKAHIASKQKIEEFNEEGTIEEIKERIEERKITIRDDLQDMLELDGADEDEKIPQEKVEEAYEDDNELGWYEELLSLIQDGGGEVYRTRAYDSMPPAFSYEDIPYETDLDWWFKVILDAFDEMCRREENDS